jgi:hypothetical protein
MKVPNWQHNSGKDKRTKGTCKGRLNARKQSLKSLVIKYCK